MSRVSISLIIPVLNESRSLPRLLAAIDAQTRPPDEIIFVDAGSSDAGPGLIADWCRRPRIARWESRVVTRPGAWPGAARNAGIAAATADRVAFLDCGTVPEPTWLEALERCLTADTAAVFGLCVSVCPDRFVAWLVCVLSYGGSRRWMVLPASLVRAEVFRRIGGFREDLRSAEDLEWSARYEKVYGKRAACPDARVVYSHFPDVFSSAVKKWFQYARSTVRAGVLKRQQAAVMMAWSAIFVAAAAGPGLFLTLLTLYGIARGLVLPALRNDYRELFSAPKLVPVLVGAALVLDGAKFSGFVYEHLHRLFRFSTKKTG
jgi:glycosyltransferase involved in cell wall biosynthesis